MPIPVSPFPTQTIRSTTGIPQGGGMNLPTYRSPGVGAPRTSVGSSRSASALRALIEEMKRKQEEEAAANGLDLLGITGMSDQMSNLYRNRMSAENMGFLEDTEEKKKPWWLTGLGVLGGTAGIVQNAMYGAREGFKGTGAGKDIESWSEGTVGKNLPKWLVEAAEDAASLGYNLPTTLPARMLYEGKDFMKNNAAMNREALKQIKKGYNAEDTIGASEMLTEWGIGRNKGTVGGTARDIAALGLDVVLDPLNALTLGAASLSKQGAKAAAGAMAREASEAALETAARKGGAIAAGKAFRGSIDDLLGAVAKGSSEAVPAASKTYLNKLLSDPDNYEQAVKELGQYMPSEEAAARVAAVLGERNNFDLAINMAQGAKSRVITARDVIKRLGLNMEDTGKLSKWRADEIKNISRYLDTPINELSGTPAGQAVDQFVRRMAPGYGLLGAEIPFMGQGISIGGGLRSNLSDLLAKVGRPTGGTGGLLNLAPKGVRKAFSKTYALEQELGSKSAAAAAKTIELMDEVSGNVAQNYSAIKLNDLNQMFSDSVGKVKMGRGFVGRGKAKQIAALAEVAGMVKEYAIRTGDDYEGVIRMARDALYKTNRDGVRMVAKEGKTVFEVQVGDETVQTFVPKTLDDIGIEDARKAAQAYADDYSATIVREAEDTASRASKTAPRKAAAPKKKGRKTPKVKRVIGEYEEGVKAFTVRYKAGDSEEAVYVLAKDAESVPAMIESTVGKGTKINKVTEVTPQSPSYSAIKKAPKYAKAEGKAVDDAAEIAVQTEDKLIMEGPDGTSITSEAEGKWVVELPDGTTREYKTQRGAMNFAAKNRTAQTASGESTYKYTVRRVTGLDELRFKEPALTDYVSVGSEEGLHKRMSAVGATKRVKQGQGKADKIVPTAAYEDRFVQIENSAKFDAEVQVGGETPVLDSLWYIGKNNSDRQWYAYRADGIELPKGDKTGKAFKQNKNGGAIPLGHDQPTPAQARQIIADYILKPFDLKGTKDVDKMWSFMNRPIYDNRGAVRFISDDEGMVSEFGLVIDGRAGKIVDRYGRDVLDGMDAVTATDTWMAMNLKWRNSITDRVERRRWGVRKIPDRTARMKEIRDIHTALTTNVVYHNMDAGQAISPAVFDPSGGPSLYRGMGYRNDITGEVVSAEGVMPTSSLLVRKPLDAPPELGGLLDASRAPQKTGELGAVLSAADQEQADMLTGQIYSLQKKLKRLNEEGADAGAIYSTSQRIAKMQKQLDEIQGNVDIRDIAGAGSSVQGSEVVEAPKNAYVGTSASGFGESPDELDELAERASAETEGVQAKREFMSGMTGDERDTRRVKYTAAQIDDAKRKAPDIRERMSKATKGYERAQRVYDDAVKRGADPDKIKQFEYRLTQAKSRRDTTLTEYAANEKIAKGGADRAPAPDEIYDAAKNAQPKSGKTGAIATDIEQDAIPFYTHESGTWGLEQVGPDEWEFLLINSANDIDMRNVGLYTIASGRSKGGITMRRTGVKFTSDEIFGVHADEMLDGMPGVKHIPSANPTAGGGITTPEGTKAFFDRVFDEVHPSQFSNRFLSKWTKGKAGAGGKFVPDKLPLTAEEIASGQYGDFAWMHNPKYANHLTDLEKQMELNELLSQKFSDIKVSAEPRLGSSHDISIGGEKLKTVTGPEVLPRVKSKPKKPVGTGLREEPEPVIEYNTPEGVEFLANLDTETAELTNWLSRFDAAIKDYGDPAFLTSKQEWQVDYLKNQKRILQSRIANNKMIEERIYPIPSSQEEVDEAIASVMEKARATIDEAAKTGDAGKIAPDVAPVPETPPKVVRRDTPAEYQLRKAVATYNKTKDILRITKNENRTVTVSQVPILEKKGVPLAAEAREAAAVPIGTFDTAEDAVDYINTFRLIVDEKSDPVQVLNKVAMDDAIMKLKAAGIIDADSDVEVMSKLMNDIIEMERDILTSGTNSILREELEEGVSYAGKERDYYSQGVIPLRKNLSKREKALYEAFGADTGAIETNMARMKEIMPSKNLNPQQRRIRELLGEAVGEKPYQAGTRSANFTEEQVSPISLLFRSRNPDAPLPFEMNMLKRLEGRAQSSSVYRTNNNLVETYARTLGSKISQDEKGTFIIKNKAKEYINLNNFLAKRRVIDTEGGKYLVDDATRNVFDKIFDPPVKELGKMQSLTSQWLVPLMTVFKPAFIINNTVGNIDLGMRNGMIGAQELVQQKKILRYIKTLEGGEDILRVGKKTFRVKDVADDQLRRGVIAFSGKDPYLMESGLEKAAGMFDAPVVGKYMQFMRGMNTQSENLFRGAAYLRGVYRRGYDPNVAMNIVNDTLFDYSRAGLTDFEKGIRKVVPFYNWTRRNLPASVDFVRRKPFMAYNMYVDGMAALSNDPNDPERDITVAELGDFWQKSLTEFQRQNGIPIMRDGEYINPKLPMSDAMSFMGLGQDLVRGAQGKNPNWLMDILDFGQQFLGPAPKELAKLVTGRDEYGQPIVQNEGILGTDIMKGQVGGAINSLIGSIPGISTPINAALSEKRYQDTGGRKGNQFALDNLLPNITKRGLKPGSWMMSQSGQQIDQDKVSRDWMVGTDYELQDRFAAEDAEGGALPQGLSDYKTYAQTALMSPAETMTQQIAQAKIAQLMQAEKDIDRSQYDDVTKQMISNQILSEYMKLVAQFYGTDPSKSLAEQIPRYPLNAGLKGMQVGIPQQFENAMAGRSYNQDVLSEYQKAKAEAYRRQQQRNGWE